MFKKIIKMKIKKGLFVCLFVCLGVIFYTFDRVNQGERNVVSLLKDKIFNKEEMPVNLIFCHTILQMKIAERIIEQYPQEKFYTILISNSKNEKYEYYFNQIKKKSGRAYFFYYPDSLDRNRNFIPALIELKIKAMLLPEVKNIYLASIDRLDMGIFLSSYPDAEIKTFDDGTTNLIQDSFYLRDEYNVKNDMQRKNLNLIIGDWSIAKTRNSSVEHYTIFKDLKNIMDDGHRKMTYLPLFDVSKLKPSKEIKDTIKILLGSPEKEMKEVSEKATKHFGIKYATLHPRQRYELSNAITLQSPYIIEDYMLKEIEKNPHTHYEIYTFFSGAALTMKDFPNVSVYALKPSSLPSDYWLTPIYELFQKSDIPILEFDDKEK